MSDRLSRKDIKHDIKHDRFVNDVGSAYGYVASHRSQILGIAALAVAVAVLLVGYSLYQGGQRNKAGEKLAEAIAVMETPVAMTSQAAPTDPAAKQFKTEAEKHAKAEPLFKEVMDNFSRANAADVAKLYLARIAASRGDVAKARPMLEEFVSEHDDHVLASSAKFSLYEMRLASGEGELVAAELEKELTDTESLIPQDAALALLARSYEAVGNDTKAKEAYRRIINEFPDSAYTLDAQRKAMQS